MSKIRNILASIGTIFALIGLINGLDLLMSTDFMANTYANDQKIVTIFDGESKQTVATDKKTVAEVLKQAKIDIEPADIVEPEVDKKIADGFFINIYRATPITVIDGNKKIKIITPYKQLNQIINHSELKFYPEDQARIEINHLSPNQDVGVQLIIKRAKLVNLDFYGHKSQLRTQAQTVGDFLKQRAIELKPEHKVNYRLTDKIVDKMNLELWQEGEQEKTVEEDIAYNSRKIYNYDKPASYRAIKIAGKLGKKLVTYKVKIKNKREISRQKINQVVVTQPVQEVIEIGVKGVLNSPSENENITWDYLIKQGFTPEQTAGIMGNLMQEHRFSTSDVPGGLGIAQWIGGRRTRLINKYPNSYLSIYSQLDYMMFELNSGSIANRIKNASTIEQALVIFQNQFERCGVCMQDRRMQYAMNIYATHYEK